MKILRNYNIKSFIISMILGVSGVLLMNFSKEDFISLFMVTTSESEQSFETQEKLLDNQIQANTFNMKQANSEEETTMLENEMLESESQNIDSETIYTNTELGDAESEEIQEKTRNQSNIETQSCNTAQNGNIVQLSSNCIDADDIGKLIEQILLGKYETINDIFDNQNNNDNQTNSSGGSDSPNNNSSNTDTSFSSFQNEVVRLVNIERTNVGLNELVLDETLSRAATVRAKEIISNFSHTRPNGTSCFTVLDEFKISYGLSAENIAGGQKSPQDVVNAWMNSEGHRANILNGKLKKIGVGIESSSKSNGYYWAQLFTN